MTLTPDPDHPDVDEIIEEMQLAEAEAEREAAKGGNPKEFEW